MDTFHVFPVNDLREHVVDGWEEGRRCWCRPDAQELEDRTLIVHNAMDQREKYETGELRLQ